MTAGATPQRIGKYQVQRLLGSGGMGRVYLATDPDIGRQVAIKQVTLATDPQARERFVREAQTMGRLNHPNITTLLEFSADGDAPFLVLELLSGEDLTQWLHRPHSLREQLQVMIDVAQAIDAAHRAGILHRDLKPDNVRVLEDGRCKLLDFGIAQSGAGQLTAAGFFVGTPECVAPEVMSGAAHTAAADLYGLGLLYYVVLSGQNPFRGDTVQATVARVIQRIPPPLGSVVLGVPPALATLVAQCLSKQPQDRPNNAGEIVTVLQQCLAATPADACLREAPSRSDTAAQAVAVAAPATRTTQVRAPTRQVGGWLLAAVAAFAGVAVYLTRQPDPVPVPAATSPATQPLPAVPAPMPASPSVTDDAVSAPPQTVEPVATTSAPVAVEQTQSTVPDAAAKPLPASTGPAVDPAPRPSMPTAAPTPAPTATVEPAAPTTSTEPPVATLPRAQSLPEPAAESDPPPPTVAATDTPPVIEVTLSRVTPQVLKAGRSTLLQLSGTNLDAVNSAIVSAGGTPDSRFRIGELHHAGDGNLSFNIAVARGVPLGSYALVLNGPGVRGKPWILEVSL